MTYYGFSDLKESGGPRKRFRTPLKSYFYFGILLASIIWGSSFLLYAIDNFKTSVHLQSILDNYASPSKKSTDFGGKIPLSKQVYNEHILTPITKDIQWIREPQSIHNDQGTYVIKQDVEGKGFQVVVKSMVDENYEYTLIEESTFEFENIKYHIDDFIASPDLQKVVVKTNITHSWRHSTFAFYWIMDIKSKKIQPVYNSTNKVSTVSWSPDSNNIAFIYENNIYLKDIEQDKITQITSDGSRQIFNGKPDWVYEEEVFASDIVLWWSPNGKKFAFLRSDNTAVPEYLIPFYAQPGFEQYPELVNIKYPKAGFPNPKVDILTYDISKQQLSNHELKSTEISPKDRLITEVVWVGDSVLVKTSNRASDLLEIYLIDQDNVDLIRSLHADKSWFEITSHTIYIPKNKTMGRKYHGYIDTVVEDGYNHLAYFAPPENPKGQLLTKGKWEVVGGVEAFDHNTNQVYFTSTMKSSIERHVHAVDLLDRTNDGIPYVKDITTKEGWYECSFSSGARFLYLSDKGPGIPSQRINDLKMQMNVTTIEDNYELKKRLQKYSIPEIRYETVELEDENGEAFLINAMETLPLNFDRKKKYPVLFYIYGGPGSQQVTKRWAISFSSLVAAELDAVVVTVDGRGTGFNNLNYKMGSNFKFIVRDKLGQYEPLDVIAAGRNWSKRSYVDPKRIAVWGWSYGGYLTLKTLETDTNDSVFSYGVSIAPVTDWKLYDSIYTERYLRTPQDNPDGYQIGSIHNVSNFSHVKRFFIGHGTGDDNVHIQHSYQLLDKFNLAEIENFEFMAFPDSNHGMNYHNGNKVVYDRILDFLKRAFDWKFI
ncbi:DAPB [[Candida] subhashii]|uniref:DAPB n=1 Tax=[Candida] subhashii TaxID=561895 RepID=A0A8J5UXB8_9ASCO|nr:DAPB [[Candida] subhashii]KAG7662254.1 DAPB [[Candida] subhashii]